MKHYTAEELDLYRHGEFSIPRKWFCQLHLRHCQNCRKTLAALSADDWLLRDLREACTEFSPENQRREPTTASGGDARTNSRQR